MALLYIILFIDSALIYTGGFYLSQQVLASYPQNIACPLIGLIILGGFAIFFVSEFLLLKLMFD